MTARHLMRDASLADSAVRDGSGALILLHHATHETYDVRDMAPFAHFGTRAAARERIFETEGARLISAHLDIRKPLVLEDTKGTHDLRSYLDLIAFSEADREISPLREQLLSYEQDTGEGLERLAEILLEKGWDGIRYRNDHEDPGKDSWITLRPEQVRVVRDGPCAQSLDAWQLSQDEFIGPSMVADMFDIDGRDEDYDHVWETLANGGQEYPLVAAREGWAVRWLNDWEGFANLGLFSPEGVASGFYLDGMAWVDEAARGRGLSGMMIAAAADLNGGSPIQDHRGLGFSEAGFAAHASAHRKLREWALDQGYDVVEIDDWDGLGL